MPPRHSNLATPSTSYQRIDPREPQSSPARPSDPLEDGETTPKARHAAPLPSQTCYAQSHYFNNEYYAIGYDTGEIELWINATDPDQPSAWRHQGTWLAHPPQIVPGGVMRKISALAFSADNELLASADATGAIKVWSTDSMKAIEPALRARHTDAVSALAWSPSADHWYWLVSGSDDKIVCLWDIAKGVRLSVASDWHKMPITQVRFGEVDSGDEHRLESVDKSGLICSWTVTARGLVPKRTPASYSDMRASNPGLDLQPRNHEPGPRRKVSLDADEAMPSAARPRPDRLSAGSGRKAVPRQFDDDFDRLFSLQVQQQMEKLNLGPTIRRGA
ncbi:hypothetical protein VTO73DRAFT_11614 [Trametes versicolor]